MINLSEGYEPLPNTPLFETGEVVVHRLYGYRAVVVAFDSNCQADEDWYLSNQTQPSKDQPWYHLLVDGAQHVTYSAESNLHKDGSKEPIVHPMLNLFFFGLDEDNNKYLQSDSLESSEPPEAPLLYRRTSLLPHLPDSTGRGPTLCGRDFDSIDQ